MTDDNDDDLRWCVLLPAYQEGGRIGDTVKAAQPFCSDVVVVDDGSSDGTAAEAEAAGAIVVPHERNMGKGVALKTGFQHVMQAGYDCVVTMDGDGQHAPEDLPGFLEAYRRSGARVVVGNRMADPKTMPLVRRLTNRFMSGLLSRRMGQHVPDTQNGYRLYGREVLPILLATVSEGFAAESEVLLDLSEAGESIASAPTRIIYGDECSKIRPVRDTITFFSMLKHHKGNKGATT
ncbi:MAG: glycosyltransferase family 2 protein [Verrucomicrobia bacterium]|jgi:glycosyltransferase involved in cell wall biosynthesis|nr:glycosyltransferase family 2 protein [Verrucomicrobiota bacterium]MBT7068139.1 glycosyltransferase family 2 protein [Verrucomicrobiota bacterium]MBT7699057.1 glycosyltransferase family 2 protein [Verrucomicrobiota bacterium]